MNYNITNFYFNLPSFAQTLAINIFELNQWSIYRTKRFKDELNFLLLTEKWKKDDLINYQNMHLRMITRYAYNYVPFYHNLYKKYKIDITQIKSVDDLYRLPIVKKEDIAKYSHLFHSKLHEKYITRQTSGTTGTPLRIGISSNLERLYRANERRRCIWAGCNGDLIARFVGDKPVKNCNDVKLYRRSYVMNRLIFPSYCLSLRKFPYIIKSLRKMNVKVLQCYPSTAYLLAKFLEISDEKLPLKALLYSSEPMHIDNRKLIEEQFQTKLFGFYGQAENLISAIECENSEYHISMVDGILEIMNNGQKIPPGEKGFTVGTSLHNYAMPLIRYELNDYTGYKDIDCACGRTLPIIYNIDTKIEDFIITPSGRIISTPNIMSLISDIKWILESQVIQKSEDSIIIRIVPLKESSEKDEAVLLNLFNKFLGWEMSIRIEFVKMIHQTKAFKKRRVINELGKEYIEKKLQENW
jgi:phenylacetate-CoA ligase